MMLQTLSHAAFFALFINTSSRVIVDSSVITTGIVKIRKAFAGDKKNSKDLKDSSRA